LLTSKALAVRLVKTIVVIHRFLTPLKTSLLITFWGQASQCRHQPTCSEYLLQQVQQKGWRGFPLGLQRIMSCHE